MAIRNYVAALVTAGMCALPIAAAPMAAAAIGANNYQSQQGEQVQHDLAPRTGIVTVLQAKVPSSSDLMPLSNHHHHRHHDSEHHSGHVSTTAGTSA